MRQVIDLLPHLPHVEENLRRKSYLKSSLYSARIEGNKLSLNEINFASKKNQSGNREKQEIFNILSAIHWLYSSKGPRKLTSKLILSLHKKVMKNLGPNGYFRQEPGAIFNQAGMAVYLAPPASELPDLINELIGWINKTKEKAVIKAALIHFVFEKIHPFQDGNGRVGRLLSMFILKQGGYGFRGLVSLEEFIEKERADYYYLLMKTSKNLTKFVEFILEGLVTQTKKALEELKNTKEEKIEDTLLPRRSEILSIIRDHRMISFDFLKRRFSKISPSTLHYDLSCLRKQKLIKKIGSTRGVLYGI